MSIYFFRGYIIYMWDVSVNQIKFTHSHATHAAARLRRRGRRPFFPDVRFRFFSSSVVESIGRSVGVFARRRVPI